VWKLIAKCHETGSVADVPRSSRVPVITGENTGYFESHIAKPEKVHS
jgi:hypothetical protein